MARNAGQGKKAGGRIDLASFGGLVLAAVGIVGGLILEGGKVADVAQVTAAIIVIGGTFGAVMLTTPLSILAGAVRKLSIVFFEPPHSNEQAIEEIIGYATKARRNGFVSLEAELDHIDDRFLRKALSLAVDGTDLQELRKMMELELMLEEERSEAEAKVYEVAGGYAPTIGIIGAVLGLIQVMKHLENIEEVGHGIAVAFVATVYGVASANLFFLPAGSKIKARGHHALKTKELMLEGVCSMVEGMNPKLIRMKLEAYTHEAGARGAAKPEASTSAARRAVSAEG